MMCILINYLKIHSINCNFIRFLFFFFFGWFDLANDCIPFNRFHDNFHKTTKTLQILNYSNWFQPFFSHDFGLIFLKNMISFFLRFRATKRKVTEFVLCLCAVLSQRRLIPNWIEIFLQIPFDSSESMNTHIYVSLLIYIHKGTHSRPFHCIS